MLVSVLLLSSLQTSNQHVTTHDISGFVTHTTIARYICINKTFFPFSVVHPSFWLIAPTVTVPFLPYCHHHEHEHIPTWMVQQWRHVNQKQIGYQATEKEPPNQYMWSKKSVNDDERSRWQALGATYNRLQYEHHDHHNYQMSMQRPPSSRPATFVCQPQTRHWGHFTIQGRWTVKNVCPWPVWGTNDSTNLPCGKSRIVSSMGSQYWWECIRIDCQ